MEIIEFLSPKGAPPHFADEKIEAHGVSAKSSGPHSRLRWPQIHYVFRD